MRPILSALALAVIGPAFAPAVESPVFTWTSSGGAFADGSNWAGGIAPPTDGTAALLMPGNWGWMYFNSGDVTLDRIQLGSPGEYQSYGTFSSERTTTLHLLNGITSPSYVSYATFASGLTLDLVQDQTWQLSNWLNIYSDVIGTGRLTINGSSGYYYSNGVYLGGNNTYSGGTSAVATRLQLGSSSAFGTGAVSLTSSGLIHSGPLTIANAVTLAGTISIENYSDRPENTLSLDGAVTLDGNVVITNYASSSLHLNGGVGQTSTPAQLVIEHGSVVLAGASTYTGGTQVGGSAYNQARLIFGQANAVPTTGLISAYDDSYVGAAFATNLQTTLLARLDPKNFLGTLGLDTNTALLETGPTVFAEDLDLTAIAPTFRGVGSASRAHVTGTLDFGDNDLRFGGGGGELTVFSDLTSPTHNLVVSSPYGQPLTLILEGNNAFAHATIDSAIVRFSGPQALPGGASITLEDGYVSVTPSTGLSVSDFVGRIAQSYGHTIVGFDTEGEGTRVIGDVDLSPIPTNDGYVFLGTATNLKVTGTIAPGSARFAAINGGFLEIASDLGADLGSVTVGLHSALDAQAGTVALTGENTYHIGTTLQSGRLAFSESSVFDGGLLHGPLGTGTLTVAGASWPTEATKPTLVPLANGLTLHNPIGLDEDLTVGDGGDFSLTLAGQISGPGSLTFANSGTLHLTNANSLYGGLFTTGGGTLVLDHNQAAGEGAFELNDGSAIFSTEAPILHGLASWSYESSVQLATNSVLSLDLRRESGEGIGPMTDYFYGSISGENASIHLQAGTLYLNNASSYSGSTLIGTIHYNASELRSDKTATEVSAAQQSVVASTLVANHSNALGTGTVEVHDGGTLIVAAGTTLANTLHLNEGSTLGGNGTLAAPDGVTVGYGATLSPGQSPGTLSFDTTLTFASGGQLLIEIADATGGLGTGWDGVAVINGHALVITALPATPFEITVASLATEGWAGAAANFDASQTYTWTILTAGAIEGFSASAFTINTAGFLAANAATGNFTLTQSDNTLQLTFAPVPEPSTYALMAIGTGILAVTIRRRRR